MSLLTAKHDNHRSEGCQDVMSELTKQMNLLWEKIKAKNNQNSPQISLKLTLQELSIMLAYAKNKENSIVVLLNTPLAKTQSFLEDVKAWSSISNVSNNWQIIGESLSEQEQNGLIQTDLSTALHTLLNSHKRPATIIIPSEVLASAVPDPTTYQKKVIELTVNEQKSLRDLKENLVAAGYKPSRSTQKRRPTHIESGTFRVRGEMVDIAHAIEQGNYTITFHHNLIENIVQTIPPRTRTVQRVEIPPVHFPSETTTWSDLLKEYTVIRPAHEETIQGRHTILYDTLNPDVPFPYQEQTETTKVTKEHQTQVIVYENLDHVKSLTKDNTNSTLCHIYAPECARRTFHIANETVEIISEKCLAQKSPTYQKPASREQGFTAAQQLSEGRPAVHADHGIGIYEGLHRRTINNTEHEYLVMRYAEGDTLSVPVEFAHKISAYIGTDTPPLHRLGESSWLKTRRRAKKNAQLLARELLKIAGKRAHKARSPYTITEKIERDLATTFPYELTPDQERTWQEVHHDLTHHKPMDRLIVGDVGFGKTEIAIRAAGHILANKKQVAVIAPTTLLVQQHYDTWKNRLKNQPTTIGLLSRFTPPKEQQKIRKQIAEGDIQLAIGTHSLLSKGTTWYNLGLVIIDEEQRFGVQQKEHFKKIRASIDILSLSATPIPRTLYMALSGLKNLSVISTPPKGRRDVITKVNQDSDQIISNAIRNELKRKGQVYVVAPRIAQLHTLHARLKKLFPKNRCKMAHAQLDDRTLATIMHEFDNGDIDILLCSKIVEHGLDLPNANTLIVYDATHFGLADLYQLRGRIGRRERQGYAYFLYRTTRLTDIQRQRLTAITEASRLGSGWQLAQRDLEMRGAGNMLGAEQSGSIQDVGLTLYSDLVRHEVAQQEGRSLPTKETEIYLPLPSLIPRHYIANLQQRTQWYQNLARALSQEALIQQTQEMTKTFGPPPPETRNLILILELQLTASSCGITKITSTTITPPRKPSYERLEISANNIPELIPKLVPLGEWTVRGTTLMLEVNKITYELIQSLAKQLHASKQKQ